METAIQAIYRDLEYAKTLIKHRAATTAGTSTNMTPDPIHHYDDDGNIEESWTFIGDDSDPELVKRIVEWNPESVVRRESSMKREVAKETRRESSTSKAAKRLSVRGRDQDR